MLAKLMGLFVLFWMLLSSAVYALQPMTGDELDAQIGDLHVKKGEKYRLAVQFSGAMAFDTTRSLKQVTAAVCQGEVWRRIDGSFMHCWNQQADELLQKIGLFQQFRKTPVEPVEFQAQLAADGKLKNIQVLGVDEDPAIKKQFVQLLSKMGFGRLSGSNQATELSIIVERQIIDQAANLNY